MNSLIISGLRLARRGLRSVGPLPLATLAALAAVGLLPAFQPRFGTTPVVNLVVVAVIALALVLLAVARGSGRHRRAPGVIRPTIELLFHLSPVVLLTVIFPIASERIAHVKIGGTELTSLWLGASLTIPWLSQVVCLPLYRGLGPLTSDGDCDEVSRRFCELWPANLLQSLPVIVPFALMTELATRWSFTALAAYAAMCALNLAFAQSVVPALVRGNVTGKRGLWALAWTCYAVALLAFPTAWYLPPLLGLASQLLPLRHHLWTRPASLGGLEVARDLGRGFLLGSVLWADKLLLFLKAGQHFPVTTVFMALLPAILAYSYYFVCLAPQFDQSVRSLRVAMERESYLRLARRSRSLGSRVESSISRTAFVGACLAFCVTWIMAGHQPRSVSLAAMVALASWLFMLNTVLCYKLDYIGQSGLAQALSGLHLLVCVGVFLAFPPGASLYGWLAVLEMPVFLLTLVSCLRQWRTPEYTLFWRHATAW
jgi:hypothetical protein